MINMRAEDKKLIFFVIKFFVIFFVLYALLFVAPLDFIEEWISGFEAGILGLKAEGKEIFIGENVFVISESCTGFVSGIILFAVIFSLRKPEIWKKAVIFILGFIILFVLNLLRVYAVLYFALEFGLESAELLHATSWSVLALVILLIWYFLTKKICRIEKFNELL